MTVACLKAGSKLAHDGSVWTVVALSGDRATIEDRVAGSTRSVAITHLLSAPGSRLLDAPIALPRPAIGPLLANLDAAEMQELNDRAAHMLELTTGYRSGDPMDALPGEPREHYRSGTARMDRYQAKAVSWASASAPCVDGSPRLSAIVRPGWSTGAKYARPGRCAGSILAGWTS